MLHSGDRDDGRDGEERTRSGTVFVLVCAGVAAALIPLFALVGPRLEQATLARAPDPAPVEVAAGELDGREWRATAVEPTDELPCLRLEVDGRQAAEICGDRRGPSGLRTLEVVDVGDAALLGAVVDARTAAVTVAPVDGQPDELAVTYADFGFPMGFVAGPAPQALGSLTAVDDDGEVRGVADCRLGVGDHDPEAHVVPPTLLGADSGVLGEGCLLLE